MSDVKRRKNESFEAMFRRFNKRVKSSGTILESRKRRHHTKKMNDAAQKSSKLRKLKMAAKRSWLQKIGLLK